MLLVPDVEALGGLVVILKHDRHGQLTISENADLDVIAWVWFGAVRCFSHLVHVAGFRK